MVAETLPTVGITQLVGQASRAVISPQKTFGMIRPTRIQYRKVLPVLFIAGVAWIHLHGYLLFTRPIWESLSRDVLYSLTFGFFPIFSWSQISVLIWAWHRKFFSHQRSLPEFEQAVFYILFLWLILPLFDLPHLYFDVPLITLPIFGTHPLHFSLIIAIIFITVEVYAFFSVFYPSARAVAFVIAIVALPIAKFVLEDIAFLFEKALFDFSFIDGKYDDAIVGAVGTAPAMVIVFFTRYYFLGWGIWYGLSRGLFFAGVFSVLIMPFVKGQQPLYPGFTSDSGVLDSSDGVAREKDFVYPDTVLLDFNPVTRPIKELKCVVNFLKTTHRVSVQDSKLLARCDIAPGPQKGEGKYLLIGEEWHDIGSAGEMTTVWKDASLLSKLTEQNNDIRVHLETGPGDIIVFSGVWVEFVR